MKCRIGKKVILNAKGKDINNLSEKYGIFIIFSQK